MAGILVDIFCLRYVLLHHHHCKNHALALGIFMTLKVQEFNNIRVILEKENFYNMHQSMYIVHIHSGL